MRNFKSYFRTLIFTVLVSKTSFGQTLIYEDLFSSNGSGGSNTSTATVNGTAPNNTNWRYTEFENSFGPSWEFNGGTAILSNTYGVNRSFGANLLYKGGNNYYSAPGGLYEQTAAFTTVFTNNTGIIEWTINFRSPDETPQALTNGGAGFTGGAFVLGLDSPTLKACNYTTNGYAVTFGDASGSGNYVKLVRVNGGTTDNNCATNNQPTYTFFNWNGTNTTTCIISDNTNLTTNWYSVKVQYNPVNDEWRLFVRNDGSSPQDPQNLSSTHCKGAKVDATYTNTSLSIMGIYACLPDDNAVRRVLWDNLRIKKDVQLISGSSNGLCGSVTALPVVVDKMNLNCKGDEIQMDWTTATEFNNDYFRIERSQDGTDFTSIVEIDGVGFSTIENNYSFVDIEPIRGVSYYRLSQIDNDGKKTVVGILSSEYPCKDNSIELLVYPNPTDGDVDVVFSHDGRVEYSVEMFDAVGQLVIPEIEENSKEPGTTMLKLKTSELSEGVFLIRVVAGEKVFTKKLVVHK